MNHTLQLSLSYSGKLADSHQIDLYDAAYALIGFQRSLALTTHLILNDEIITQSPFMKGAEILVLPAEEGSWKTRVLIVTASTALAVGVAPKDSFFGHLIFSAYDYLISESLGVHVDYAKSLGEQYEKARKAKAPIKVLEQHRFDSLIEKCNVAIKEMHRPIVGQHTAVSASITAKLDGKAVLIGQPLTANTYEYIAITNTSEVPEIISGSVSSYNMNTFKGRIFIPSEGRPISFDLSKSSRDRISVALVANSLAINVNRGPEEESRIYCMAYRRTSKSGTLKGFDIIAVSKTPLE